MPRGFFMPTGSWFSERAFLPEFGTFFFVSCLGVSLPSTHHAGMRMASLPFWKASLKISLQAICLPILIKTHRPDLINKAHITVLVLNKYLG